MVIDRNNHLFVGGSGVVGEYDATTGATINANFITGLTGAPQALVLDGNNHLYLDDVNLVGEYDATTGATINANFIGGLNNPRGLAVDNKNHVFVANENSNAVGEYDATTGATINAAFINGHGLNDPHALLLDGLGHLLVGDDATTATVGMYDATTGATINAAFIPGGAGGTHALVMDGNNHLFVSNYINSVGEYDATTGATINENFVTGLQEIDELAFVAGVPEPSSLLLVAGAAAVGLWRRKWIAGRRGTALLVGLTVAVAAGPAEARQVLLVASNNTGGKYDAATGAAINVSFFSPPGAGFYPMVVDQYNHFFIAGNGNGGAVVSEYNATTGATINANFITVGLTNVWGLALDGNNHLFVSENGGDNNAVVGKYDATTGATINASFIQGTDGGLNNPHGVAADNKNHLFVTDNNANTVGEYNATTGAVINAAFIKSQGQGLHDPQVLLLDGLGHLLVGDNYDTATVGMYDATTGATINAAFVPGLPGGTWALALDGSNHLFVGNNNFFDGVGEYDATTGATINDHFITGLHVLKWTRTGIRCRRAGTVVTVAGGRGGRDRRPECGGVAERLPFERKAAGESQPRRRTLTGPARPRRSVCAPAALVFSVYRRPELDRRWIMRLFRRPRTTKTKLPPALAASTGVPGGSLGARNAAGDQCPRQPDHAGHAALRRRPCRQRRQDRPESRRTPAGITLTQGELLLTQQNLTIDTKAGQPPVTISGGNLSRIFEVATGASVTLHNLTITDGNAQTGNPADPHEGRGGGIVVDEGATLTITDSTVTDNSAPRARRRHRRLRNADGEQLRRVQQPGPGHLRRRHRRILRRTVLRAILRLADDQKQYRVRQHRLPERRRHYRRLQHGDRG